MGPFIASLMTKDSESVRASHCLEQNGVGVKAIQHKGEVLVPQVPASRGAVINDKGVIGMLMKYADDTKPGVVANSS